MKKTIGIEFPRWFQSQLHYKDWLEYNLYKMVYCYERITRKYVSKNVSLQKKIVKFLPSNVKDTPGTVIWLHLFLKSVY